ncbi:MAG: hypothetical protein QNJ63_25960 [Calothrix sp. MO_192.B10]|nr:hypothetical protein [Calothrix sp. MO_192.B10]
MLGFVPQTPLTTTEGTSLRVNPSDTLREQHFAYAGEPVHRKCFTATEWLPNLQFMPILGLKTRPTPPGENTTTKDENISSAAPTSKLSTIN